MTVFLAMVDVVLLIAVIRLWAYKAQCEREREERWREREAGAQESGK